jgi:rubrerythrin
MKASSEKSSSTTSTATNKTASQPFFAKSGGGNFFAPVKQTASIHTGEQPLSSPILSPRPISTLLPTTARAMTPTSSGSDSGTRMYRTSNGQMVELPSDMTIEQASRLEAEAKTAEKQLGKGSPPKPVPNINQPAKKEAKTARAKAGAKGKSIGRAKGKTIPKAAGAISALLKGVGSGKVAQYLAAKGTPVLARGIGQLQNLKQNEQTHDDATEKLQQSEKAVIIPPSEGQSKSNTEQVGLLSNKPAPAVDESKAKQKLQESLKENIPQSIEDVDNFKRDKKAQHMGADVMSVALGDKNAVVSTFAEMETTPPPTPPEQTPEALPPEEIAPPTAAMNLGQGTIAPLQQEHTDLSNYTKEADGKLKEEGITQEQLDMVDSGDLATANKEKKALEKSSKTEPLAVQTFARQTSNKVDLDLKQNEKQARDGLKAKRKIGLGTTAQKQKGTKSTLEKKREEISIKINSIHMAAQLKVKLKLTDLETTSKKWFDDDNAKATEAFQNNVDRELAAFKKQRYSGFFGWARKAKDWLLGMDNLPEVSGIFARNRSNFEIATKKLVSDITLFNKLVIKECKEALASARMEIQVHVNNLGPGLKAIGIEAQKEMNAKLADLDNAVAKTEQDLGKVLAEKQQSAIKAIDQKIEKMKEDMSGALSKLGKLLLLAAKKFFTWALEKFGYSLQEIEAIINKGTAILKAIFTQPIQFVKNLMNAAITGFKNFGKNFLKHLKNALFEWLTGSLEGLVLPQTWDFKGIISVALQMIGISYQNIRKHMVAVMGEPIVAGIEKTFTLVKTLITEGPIAAWEQLKEMASEMRDAFIEAVKDFIKTKIIEQAIQWLVSLFIPGAGIIKAIIGIYDTIVFFIQKAKQIMQMISSFLGSIAEIAAGNIGAAADAMESGLARGLSLVISFLAQLLHLSGITNKIKAAIQKIRDKVDAVLLKVAKWIADKAGKLLGSVKAAVGRVTEWWKAKKPFKTKGGESHEVFYSGDEKNAIPMVASKTPKPVSKKLEEFNKQTSGAQASAEEKTGKALIAMTQSIVKKDPNDPNLVVNMKQLFEIYDEGGSGKETKVTRRTGSLGGDIVGLEMTVDWLGSNHKTGTPPKSSAQLKLMGLLVTDPSKSSPDKFIRGHLLNEHLGGEGDADNMFPITGNANSQHLHSTETKIKNWVKDKNHWVLYQVKVQDISSKLDAGAKNPSNYVNSAFACHAIQKNAAGEVKDEFSTRISSTYTIKRKADVSNK